MLTKAAGLAEIVDFCVKKSEIEFRREGTVTLKKITLGRIVLAVAKKNEVIEDINIET